VNRYRYSARLLSQRLLVTLLTMLIVSFIVFFATTMLPGDVAQAMLGQSATPEAVAGLRHAMGLDVPAYSRFLSWLWGLLHGDLGRSYVTRLPISEMIGDRLNNSLKLALLVTLVSVPFSMVLGITSAILKDSTYDAIVSAMTIAVISVPEFLIATLAILIFAVWLHWLPAISYGALHAVTWTKMFAAYAMPVITLTFVVSAQMIRMTRAAMIEAINRPYVEMAVLKGASRARIVLWHVLPNAVGPIANAMALSLSYLLGGVIVAETIFDYPGVAKLMVDAVSTRDLPLIQSCAILFCFCHLIMLMFADLVAILSNPRSRA